MNISRAARETLSFLETKGVSATDHLSPNIACDFFHVVYMLKSIELEVVTGEKAHRWLGWAQGCIVAGDVGCLEDMKQINKDA